MQQKIKINMDIKAKLRRLERTAKAGAPPARSRLDLPEIAARLGGEVHSGISGQFILVVHRFPLARAYGAANLRIARQIPGTTLKKISKNKVGDDFSLARALFIDTETTGLAGGTGTLAFLVGIGYLDDDHFIVEQLFMPAPGSEPAVLEHLHRRMQGRRGLVSYNGKSFDVPLLESRFIQNRIPSQLSLHDHLDLLHAARRIWQDIFENCNLATLERRILGIHREGDISGDEIPQVYMNFLRYGELERLTSILYHNRMDIVSLLALCIVLYQRIEQPDIFSLPQQEVERVARLHAQTNSFERAAHIFESLANASGSESPQHRAALLMQHASAQKKQGQFEAAVASWKSVVELSSSNIDAFVELAKHYEHRERRFDIALKYTERARAVVETRMRLQGETEEIERLQRALQHRTSRLQAKLKKVSK